MKLEQPHVGAAVSQSDNALLMDPANPDDRVRLFDRHPVVIDEFQIPTPPVRTAFNIVAHTIATGNSGCGFLSFPRFGKTATVKYLVARLPDAFPNIPMIVFHPGSEQKRKDFYKQLLQQSGLYSPPGDPFDALVRAWWTMCEAHNSRRLVLFCDVAQNLNHQSLQWFMDISDSLETEGVRMTYVLFADRRILNLRDQVLREHRGDIIGRFLLHLYQLDGIGSAMDLREVLDAYDDPGITQFPAASGWSYTRFFFPVAYNSGFRLRSSASDLWDVFRDIAVEKVGPARAARMTVGMQWIARSIQHAMTQYFALDSSQWRLQKAHWKEAVSASGFGDTLGKIYDPDWVIPL